MALIKSGSVPILRFDNDALELEYCISIILKLFVEFFLLIMISTFIQESHDG